MSAAQGLPLPAGAQLVAVDSAQAMLDAVLDACRAADALIMAAAVADFRPAHVADQKIKKLQGTPTLELAANPDILATLAEERRPEERLRVVVGFAAETQNLLANAQSKLERKRLDLIVANDVTAANAGFAVETNLVTLLRKDGSTETLPLQSKAGGRTDCGGGGGNVSGWGINFTGNECGKQCAVESGQFFSAQ
ncbi:MAG: phosphopantothenoylcysteine decarboxylase [Caldilineaceae bacterium]